jgi:uncharacterized protein (TIGR03118 family)
MHEITRHPEVPVDRRAAHQNGTRGVGSRRRRRAGVGAVLGLFVLGLLGSQVGAPAVAHSGHDDDDDHHHGSFKQTNLVSDVPGLAQLLDEEVKNPWGIAFGPDTALWVNNNFNPASVCPEDEPECLPAPEDLLTKITLYRGANGVDPISKVPLEVTASSPFGIVFNPTSKFRITQDGVSSPARFLFNEVFVNPTGDGPEARITGWSNVPAAARVTTSTAAREDQAVHLGLAMVPADSHHGPWLLAADGVNGDIDVFNGRFHRIRTSGLFVDPHAQEQGLAPYNVAFLKGRVYVTYAGAEGGALSVFERNGEFRKRLVTNEHLATPWGMAIAPSGWGDLGGSILVGNVDSGEISAFDRRNGHFRGTVNDAQGHPLVNLGLWGIAFGNGVIGTPRTLIFAAGIGTEVDGITDEVYEHGLVGTIEPSDHEDDDD